MNVVDRAAWNAQAAQMPEAHVLQSWEWGEFKEGHGWRARRLKWETDGGPVLAQVLVRSMLRGLKILYVPRGPLADWVSPQARAAALDELQALARRERAVLIKIDPGQPLAIGDLGHERPQPAGVALQAELVRRGWQFSREQVQFRNTVVLDLRLGPEALLAGMKQKTRYNVRLAERRGVTVRHGSLQDLELLYRLYAETSARDGFLIRPAGYYHDAWGRFMQAGMAQAFVAEVAGEPVAALVVLVFAGRAVYMYGMSRDAHRDKMPNHLLQWRAICWAQQQGCHAYDFWGAPDEFDASDGMWGVWKFKEGFGGRVVRGLGAWDYAPSPGLYRLYAVMLPRLLALMRRTRRAAADN
jgi:peptidoglycan pentaglycine glycine transferase (the first glycine)